MNLQAVIGGIGALAPFPQTAVQIIEPAGDESRSLAEIADLVKTDATWPATCCAWPIQPISA